MGWRCCCRHAGSIVEENIRHIQIFVKKDDSQYQVTVIFFVDLTLTGISLNNRIKPGRSLMRKE